MTNYEISSRSSGDIGILDRAIRITIGLSVLFATLFASIGGPDAYPEVKLMAATIVLTGIAGWDPLYAAYRSTVARLNNKTRNGNTSFNPA